MNQGPADLQSAALPLSYASDLYRHYLLFPRYMSIVAIAVATLVTYGVILVLGRNVLTTAKAARLASVSANIWLTLGGMMILYTVYKDQLAANVAQQRIGSDFQNTWNACIQYMAQNQREIPELINALYGIPSHAQPRLYDPSTMLAVDFITGQMWKSWMLEIELDDTKALAGYHKRSSLKTEYSAPGDPLTASVLLPEMRFIGQILAMPVFKEYRSINKAFYPLAFWNFADRAEIEYKGYVKMTAKDEKSISVASRKRHMSPTGFEPAHANHTPA